MKERMKSIVVAFDNNNAIGRNGELAWGGRMAKDMERVRTLTMGGAVIMGANTWDSIPERFRPLQGRQNIVMSLSRVATNEDPFAQYARSLTEAYDMAGDKEIFVLGGGKVYEQAIDTVDQLYVTNIKTEIAGADTFFPIFDTEKDWNLIQEESFAADERNVAPFAFATYLRNHPIH